MRTVLPSRAAKIKRTKGAASRIGKDWWIHEQKKLRGVKLCTSCKAVYYDGHWHTAPRLAAALKARPKKGVNVLCYECHAVAHAPAGAALFEGEVTLEGLDDQKMKAGVIAAVRAFGRRASLRDPEDRILSIEDRGPRVIVKTSENQMAAGLGKAIDAAFKGGKLKIVFSKDDLPVRVRWTSKNAA